MSPARPTSIEPVQMSLEDLGTPLAEVTFCIVDFETTGTSSTDDVICEIGAVKVRGGETIGTFQTLVNPGRALPPKITVITGLTDAVLAPAPRIEQVLASFREFLGDAVFVAHNASFDIGFARAAFARVGYEEYRPVVVDTLTLARRLFRDEVRNFKLATLAERFGIETRPSHRALEDALATRDLLHLLIERASGWGVIGLDDLVGIGKLTGHPQAKKLVLTDDLPRGPGVYLMVDTNGEVTYVGKATHLRQRVRSYFGGDERRSVEPMLRDLGRVEHIETSDSFAAEVLERRLISSLMPRHNRVGRNRKRGTYVRLDTNELWPRLSVVMQTRSQGAYLGPLQGRHEAERVIEALHSAFPIRRCTNKIGPRFVIDPEASPCSPAQLGVAPCPCVGLADPEAHAAAVEGVLRAMNGDGATVVAVLGDRMATLAAQQRFEEAAAVRDRLTTLLDATRRVALMNALLSAGVFTFRLAGTTHRVDSGRLDLSHITIPPTLDLSDANESAEQLLIARAIQRACTTARTFELLECSGVWQFPIADLAIDRLPSSGGGHSDVIDIDDSHFSAAD